MEFLESLEHLKQLEQLEQLDDRTRRRLARKVQAKRRLGQNFFIDGNLLAKIVDTISPEKNDHILEIGPGLGFLTRLLAESPARLSAIEFDPDMVDFLENNLAIPVFRGPRAILEAAKAEHWAVIEQDFLSLAIDSLRPPINKIAGNIPYQITSPILKHIFGEIGEPSKWHHSLDSIVLTMQLEVARRLVAKPGEKDYSHLTVMKEYLFDAEIVMEIPPEAFHPLPEVYSAVVRMHPKKVPPVEVSDMKLLKKLLQTGFKQRRKMLKNNLGFLPFKDSELTEIMRNLKINPAARAENLSLEQFATLSDQLTRLSNN